MNTKIIRLTNAIITVLLLAVGLNKAAGQVDPVSNTPIFAIHGVQTSPAMPTDLSRNQN